MAKTATPIGYTEIYYRDLLAFGSTHNFSFEVIVTLKPNTKYIFQTFANLTSGTATQYSVRIYDLTTDTQYVTQNLAVSPDRESFTFTTPNDELTYDILLYSGVVGETANNYFEFTDIQVFEANYNEEKTMSEMKTDWSSQDYYNFEDLNRVEEATLIVRDKIEILRDVSITLDPITRNRDETRIEFADSLNRIEGNILKLKNSYTNTTHFKESKTDWAFNLPFDFNDANRLESDLDFMYTSLEANISNIPYSGNYITGQEGVY